SSDYDPAVQALFARLVAGTTQILGTGVRTNSATAAPQKDIILSFVERSSGAEYRLTALYNPATHSGPWTLYGAYGEEGSGTLTKFDCAGPGLQGTIESGSPDLGGAGLLQP